MLVTHAFFRPFAAWSGAKLVLRIVCDFLTIHGITALETEWSERSNLNEGALIQC